MPRRRRPWLEHEPPELQLDDLSKEEVYEAAQRAALQGRSEQVRKCIDHLIKERHEQPNQRAYGVLILANIDPVNGSAEFLVRLLQEMDGQGILPGSEAFHNALKV